MIQGYRLVRATVQGGGNAPPGTGLHGVHSLTGRALSSTIGSKGGSFCSSLPSIGAESGQGRRLSCLATTYEVQPLQQLPKLSPRGSNQRQHYSHVYDLPCRSCADVSRLVEQTHTVRVPATYLVGSMMCDIWHFFFFCYHGYARR